MATERHFMNKQHGAHMQGNKGEPSKDVGEKDGQHHAPSIHIHSHSKGHTVHVMHHSGEHTKHEHGHGDVEGIKAHIDKHLGSNGSDMEGGGIDDQGGLDEYGV
jgi:hypothetical protein